MNPKTGKVHRGSREGGGNWIIIAGGAVLSTLSVRLGFKLKQLVDAKQEDNRGEDSKDGQCDDWRKSRSCHWHPNAFCFTQEENVYNDYNDQTGSRNMVELKQQQNGQMETGPKITLPLATVPPPGFNKENNMSPSSPNHLELPHKPFHQSNSSDSPCVSESGSDIFIKREVIQKLRQQLKRRDDTILEMQDQIAELQHSISGQISHSSRLKSTLDAANRDLIGSELEIHRLRKAIADRCVGYINSGEVKSNLEFLAKKRNGEKIEILKSEINELKELIKGKDYLLGSYREQKLELSMKIKELQQRLDSQLPNFL